MFLDILTRIALGTAAPAQPHVASSIPLLAAPTAVAAASSLTAADAVDKVQTFYAGIKQVTASFRQAVTNDTFGSTKTSDGTVWIMKPGKMRWDYLEKRKDKVEVKKSFISNGKYLYVVEHDNKQVMKKGDLKAEFTSELDKSGKYGGKDEIVVKLTPKQPSAQYKNLILVVSPADYHVAQSIIIDSSNNVNHFRFFSPDFEKPIKDTWFEFSESSVKNYRIVDADQAMAGSGSGSAAKK